MSTRMSLKLKITVFFPTSDYEVPEALLFPLLREWHHRGRRVRNQAAGTSIWPNPVLAPYIRVPDVHLPVDTKSPLCRAPFASPE